MKKISIVYDSFPHYRSGIINKLNESALFDYSFYGSKLSRDSSIKTFEFSEQFDFHNVAFYQLGPFTFQKNIINRLRASKSDCYIFLGNPYFLSTWFAVAFLRLSGRPVYFWSHGWLSKTENKLKRKFRNLFFSIADGIFLYGYRAKEIGINQGFDPKKLHVINNSLDYSMQLEIFNRIKNRDVRNSKLELGLSPTSKVIICSARLTTKCRFDILLNAVAIVHKKSDSLIQIVLVGDGPEKLPLQKLSKALGLNVVFWGACYDEETLCELYHVSDITVSPGKVGLTAIHSMTYGTPVLTHNNFDNQMPEYETILPGLTGDFFQENSSEDLARAIQLWFDNNSVKPEQKCVDRIAKYYTPDFQRSIIEETICDKLGV